MAATTFILKLMPADVRRLPAREREAYNRLVVEYALRRKDMELSKGLNAHGRPLPPVSSATRARRRSDMTPSGKGDPRAPYLMPGRGLSRTRSLLTGRAFPDHALFGWRFDAWTGDEWGAILAIHASRGREYNVIGLSPKGRAWVAAKAAEAWRRGDRIAPPTPRVEPIKIDVVGRTNLDYATPGIGGTLDGTRRAIAEGRSSGFMSESEWRKYFRSSRPSIKVANVGTPHSVRVGKSNVMLQHVWGIGTIPPTSGPAAGASGPKPGPKPGAKPGPKPNRAVKVSPPAPAPASTPAPSRRGAADTLVIGPGVDEPTRKHAEEALKLVDRVHSVEGLPTIPLGSDEAELDSMRALGVFFPGDAADQKIEVRPVGHNPSMPSTFLHEYGHYVDWNLFSGAHGNWKSPLFSVDPEIKEWWRVVNDSSLIKTIEGMLETERKEGRGRGEPAAYNDYLLGHTEIWARSYAQWIATRCGDRDFLALFREVNSAKISYGVAAHVWDDDDFEPIARAFDALFRSRGLMAPATRTGG